MPRWASDEAREGIGGPACAGVGMVLNIDGLAGRLSPIDG